MRSDQDRVRVMTNKELADKVRVGHFMQATYKYEYSVYEYEKAAEIFQKEEDEKGKAVLAMKRRGKDMALQQVESDLRWQLIDPASWQRRLEADIRWQHEWAKTKEKALAEEEQKKTLWRYKKMFDAVAKEEEAEKCEKGER